MVAWGGLSEKIHGKWRVLKGGEIHSTIERTEYTSIHQADTPRYTRRIHQAEGEHGGVKVNIYFSHTFCMRDHMKVNIQTLNATKCTKVPYI